MARIKFDPEIEEVLDFFFPEILPEKSHDLLSPLSLMNIRSRIRILLRTIKNRHPPNFKKLLFKGRNDWML